MDWMDFHNRQYDPQLGRFLSVDPLAGAGGQHVLSPYHAMACNPVSMVDPLGLNAGMFPGTQGAPGLSALDIALYQVPTMQLDKIYGGDPWSMMNRGALNGLEKQILEAEAIEGERIQKSYNHYVYLESKRRLGLKIGNYVVGEDAANDKFSTDDLTLKGKNRISILSGNLTLNISTRDDGTTIGIFVFGVYTGDLSKYSKTEWIQIAKTNSPLEGKPYNEWFKDYSKDVPNGGKYINNPFYHNKSPEIRAWRKDVASTHGGAVFLDGPNRGAGNYYWQGQLSLVGFRDGSWETIQTIRYGFVADGIRINYMSQFFLNARDDSRDQLYNKTIDFINYFRR